MKRVEDRGHGSGGLDSLVREIIVDAHGEDEPLWAFRQALEDKVRVPCDASVIGEPVSVTAFDYDGNARRGLTAKCRCADGSEHVVAAAHVVLPRHSAGACYLAANRIWLGLETIG